MPPRGASHLRTKRMQDRTASAIKSGEGLCKTWPKSINCFGVVFFLLLPDHSTFSICFDSDAALPESVRFEMRHARGCFWAPKGGERVPIPRVRKEVRKKHGVVGGVPRPPPLSSAMGSSDPPLFFLSNPDSPSPPLLGGGSIPPFPSKLISMPAFQTPAGHRVEVTTIAPDAKRDVGPGPSSQPIWVTPWVIPLTGGGGGGGSLLQEYGAYV